MKNKELFFCKTPLQALIVNKIINLSENLCNPYVIYIPNNTSSLHQQYFDRINAEDKIFLNSNPIKFSNSLCHIYNFFKLEKKFKASNFKKVYFSSIGDLFLSILLGRANNSELNLFDDGTFNLDKELFLNWIKKESFTEKIIRQLFGGEHSFESYKKLKCNYTIFPLSLSNWIHCPSVYIDFFPNYKQLSNLPKTVSSKKKTLRVLIGSYFTSDQHKLEIVYRSIVKNFKADLHIIHPGNREEKFFIKPSLEYLFSDNSYKNMIAEEIIFTLLKSGYKINLYGFSSTVLFNMSRYTNSFSIALDEETLLKKNFYKKFGIKLIKGF